MIALKVAMWALGMLVLSLFGVVLVNLFGNITVTDQLNYTTMKNAVEASMYDSLDIAHYRAGFCLCSNKEKKSEKWVFDDDDEYEFKEITYDENGNETCESKLKKCEILFGEYRLKPKAFSESLTRRFAEMVTNNKDYKIIIQDIVEYPPKVSVRILSKDEEYSATDSGGGYDIVNQIDAIIETEKGGKVIVTTPAPPATPTPNPSTPTPIPNSQNPTPPATPITTEPATTPTAAPTPTSDPGPKAVCCYDAKEYLYRWDSTGKCGSNEEAQPNVTEASCVNACYCKEGDKCGIWAEKTWSKEWVKQERDGKVVRDEEHCCLWAKEGSYKDFNFCDETNKFDKNPSLGMEYYTTLVSTTTCKKCATCKGGSYSNIENNNCMEVSSCSIKICEGTEDSVSCSCETKYTCDKYVCVNDFKK